MRAELRRLQSPDVNDLRRWDPDEEPAILVQLMVGPTDGAGEESFEVTLCTAEWLIDLAREQGIVDGRHHYIVNPYSYDVVLEYFTRRIAACAGDTWAAVAQQVASIGAWEFENYAG